MFIPCHFFDKSLDYPLNHLNIKGYLGNYIQIVGCQCHIPDMVLHRITHIKADSPAKVLHDVLISMPMPCPRHSLIWDHISMPMQYPSYGLIRDLINPNIMIRMP
ncbi:V (D)J recombination-activating 1 [Gossypium arboreum]|uniref:V (D)J recombination-activating 1 n=1 Tax=Gossypium arboreum TaxID=29729 RepID=A0A0B0MQQ2_GOSAR|nr:V (D)J recombination-activating 1 [Gossypium arboreum]